jgi:cytochrome c biogenesis protein CcmG/thiol:disulfide interchange protein DsbE
MRKSFLGVAILLLVFLFASTSIADPAWVGKEAPDFSVTDTKGNLVKLSALRGKVVWLNFWGLRCGPCVRELPALEKIHKAYIDKGLVIIGVNADGVDTAFINKSFTDRDDLAGMNLTFPILPDTDFALIDDYELMGAPLNVMIDKNGVVQFHHEGYEAGDEKHYEEVVNELLAK